MSNNKKPLALIILDGYGYNQNDYGNAIASANTPTMDKLLKNYTNTLIGASGMDVGLPHGQMGNSEVGHTNIGAGRIVYQELTRITKSIEDGDFFENDTLLAAIDNCKVNNSALHLMGLVSNGGVHSHNTHLYALVEMAKRAGLTKVFIHCFMDGRDVPPTSGKGFVAELEQKLSEIGVGEIASISGRYYAMDRDNRWERVVRAYNAIVKGEGNHNSNSIDVFDKSYANGITDEFIEPTVCADGKIKAKDSVIFFNFRPDRAREITRTFVDEKFNGFEREFIPVHFVCMTRYDATMPNVSVAFGPQSLANTFGEYISKNGLTQLRIAETEKYAHVTFFFNGGVELEYPGEDRALISSPKVATYDLKPEMSAYEVTDELLSRIASDKYDVIVLNFANCDMVGHTGVFDAAKAAVETVDICLGRVANAILEKDGAMLITADHGNADKMYEPDGSPFTAHTTNPVRLVGVNIGRELKEGGVLADLAPTMLELLGLEKPVEMTGKSLLK